MTLLTVSTCTASMFSILIWFISMAALVTQASAAPPFSLIELIHELDVFKMNCTYCYLLTDHIDCLPNRSRIFFTIFWL